MFSDDLLLLLGMNFPHALMTSEPSKDITPQAATERQQIEQIYLDSAPDARSLKRYLPVAWDDSVSDGHLQTAASDPHNIAKVIIIISEGFQTGDNILISPEPQNVQHRRLRLESTRPVVVLEHADTPAAYSNALKNLKFSCRHNRNQTRKFALTVVYASGVHETIRIAEYRSSGVGETDTTYNIGWLFDDSDFDMFLVSIHEASTAEADFLPKPQSMTEDFGDWVFTYDAAPDLYTPDEINKLTDQPIGLLETGKKPGDRPDADFLKRLDELDW